MEFNSNERKVSDEAQSFLVLDMMRNVVEKGTGRNARVKDIEIAEKQEQRIKVLMLGFVDLRLK